MNSKGQIIMFGFMLMVVIFILALGFSGMLRQSSDSARTDMDCTNSSIPDSTKAGCYATDLTPAYFILGIIAIGGVVLTAKILLEQ